MNIIDYIDWRGDLTFAERGLNEVDNLIFSTLTYLDMDGMIPEEGITIKTVYDNRAEEGLKNTGLSNDPMPLLKKAASSERFKNVIISDFVNSVDVGRGLQFAAACFRFAEGCIYIAFRGTDNTLVGWREDMNLAFLSETPGQYMAVEYINNIASKYPDSLIVGGHSKGGNFAVYGAAFCEPEAKKRIIRIYSNDGPGFKKSVTETEAYSSILDRTLKIIPESSLVGILLSSRANRKVIRSSVKGAMQHEPFSWQVKAAEFEETAARSAYSLFMDDTINKWVDTLSDENLAVLVDTVFEILEATGAATLSQLSKNKREAVNAAVTAMSKIDPESRKTVMEMLKKLMMTGADKMRTDTQKSIEHLISEVSKNSPIPIKNNSKYE